MQISVAYYHLKRKKQPGVLHFRLNTQEGVDELVFFFFPLDASGVIMSPLTPKGLKMLQIVFFAAQRGCGV